MKGAHGTQGGKDTIPASPRGRYPYGRAKNNVLGRLIKRSQNERQWRSQVRKIKDTIGIYVTNGSNAGAKRKTRTIGTGVDAITIDDSEEREEETKQIRGGGGDEDKDKDEEGRDHGHARNKRVRGNKPHKPIQCKDGFRMSVKASGENLCSPRDDCGPYTDVGVIYPNY